MSDKDLRFLNECTNEELDVLVKIILDRFSEMLSVDEKYKKYAPNHKMYVEAIEKEIIDFGTTGGMIKNDLFGAKPYREIVHDVCKKMDVSVDSGASLERMEQALMEMMLKKAWDSYSEEEREEFLKEMGEDAQTFLPGKAGLAGGALIKLIRMGGFAPYKWAAILANAIAKMILGRGLAFAVTPAIMRGIGVFAGPIGATVMGLYTLYDMAGPAYKVTVPAAIYIAALRQIHLQKREPLRDEDLD